MKIESKFDVGQKVYVKETGKGIVIKQIDIRQTNERDGGYDIIYEDEFSWGIENYIYYEDELTDNRPKPHSLFDLQEGDNYYSLNILGDIQPRIFDGNFFDEKVIAQGNAFLTKEDAIRERECRLIHQELKNLTDTRYYTPFARNWAIRYDNENEELYVSYDDVLMNSGIVYFNDKEVALNAIETIGEERMKKYYFGIEDQS